MDKQYLVELKLRRVMMLPEEIEAAQEMIKSLLQMTDLNRFSSESSELTLYIKTDNIKETSSESNIEKSSSGPKDNVQQVDD